VKEDAPDLLRGEEQRKARIVAETCQLFEEFASGLELPLRAVPGRILLHGHCHQKSMGMLQATMRLLSHIPGARVIDLDAGCCGMAGSFGYHREHFEVSRAIAGRRLLPAIEKMEPDDVLVAPGTSCRHQIQDFGKREAVHPAVLIHRLLA
jgi:Fe-S oxidoreductase